MHKIYCGWNPPAMKICTQWRTSCRYLESLLKKKLPHIFEQVCRRNLCMLSLYSVRNWKDSDSKLLRCIRSLYWFFGIFKRVNIVCRIFSPLRFYVGLVPKSSLRMPCNFCVIFFGYSRSHTSIEILIFDLDTYFDDLVNDIFR